MEDPERLAHRLDELVRRLAARKRVPHAVVGVERGDGFRWAGAVGDAGPGGPPIRADTPFFIASVTKLCIATVVMKLHEGGQVRLGDPTHVAAIRRLRAGMRSFDSVRWSDRGVACPPSWDEALDRLARRDAAR